MLRVRHQWWSEGDHVVALFAQLESAYDAASEHIPREKVRQLARQLQELTSNQRAASASASALTSASTSAPTFGESYAVRKIQRHKNIEIQ